MWGAILGTAAALFQLLTYLRDRPKLVVSFHAGIEVGARPTIGIDVMNRGRQPTTLMKVAFVVDADLTIDTEDGTIPAGIAQEEIELSEGRLAVVTPGRVARFRAVIEGWPTMIHADFPLWPYVVDAHGNESWGPPVPLFRVLINSGWKPPLRADDPLISPPADGQAVLPRPRVKGWKVWKPKHLRRPERPPSLYGWPPSGSRT